VVDDKDSFRAAANAAMDRYAEGDEQAFSELYDLLAPRLYQYLHRQTQNRARAEDMLQQTMLQLHVTRGRFAVGADVVPWAYAIARRVLIDGIRKTKREPTQPTENLDTEPARQPPADHMLHVARQNQLLNEELRRLPEAQRVVFELTRKEGLPMHDVALLLGTSVNAVKLRASRATAAIRAALESYAGDQKP
jgi:RNA polymerase sigma-70 factor (ECF subfamily)